MKKKIIRKHKNIKKLQIKIDKSIRNLKNEEETSSNTSKDNTAEDDASEDDEIKDDTFKNKSSEERDAAAEVIKVTENLKNADEDDAENDQEENTA